MQNFQDEHVSKYLCTSFSIFMTPTPSCDTRTLPMGIYLLSPYHPDTTQREKINLNFLLSHFFVMPQKLRQIEFTILYKRTFCPLPKYI